MQDLSSLPPGWFCLHTAEGRPYYHCRATGETSWTPPDRQASPSTSANVQPTSKTASPHKAPANICSLQQFVSQSLVREQGLSLFELEGDKLLRITLNSRTSPFAWIKIGSMIARHGHIKFSRQSIREQGFGKIMKKALTGEGMTLVKCEGTGVAYCADNAKIISVVQLSQEKLYLNGNDVLALSSSLKYDVKLMRGAGMLAGGLFNVEITGSGMVAFTCHGSVSVLKATPENPVYSDPNATVAWTHMPAIKTDLNMKSFLGRGTGEEFQLAFTQGVVVVQPFEETYVVDSQ